MRSCCSRWRSAISAPRTSCPDAASAPPAGQVDAASDVAAAEPPGALASPGRMPWPAGCRDARGRAANQAAAAAVTSNGWFIGRSGANQVAGRGGHGPSAGYSSSILFCQFMMVILIEKLKKESELD